MLGASGKIVMSSSFDAATVAHLARATNITDSSLQYDLDELIKGLKVDNIWDDIAILCVTHDNETDSLLNLKGNVTDSDSTNLGTSFTTDLGFTCSSGSSQYVALSTTAADISSYNTADGHFFIYSQALTDTVDHCIYNPSITQIVTSGGPTVFIQTASASANFGGLGGGFISGSILANNFRVFRYNDTPLEITATLVPPALGTVGCNVGKDGAIGSGSTYSAWGAGAGLSAVGLANYENRIRTFAQARGFDIY